jgi:hypothetical protein
MAFWVLLSLFPAGAMGLIGYISAFSGRRSLILFSVCLLWVLWGIALLASGRHLTLPAILCFLQPTAGLAAWVGALRSRRPEATAPAPSTSGPPATSPPATS